jgi:hypothetical protein
MQVMFIASASDSDTRLMTNSFVAKILFGGVFQSLIGMCQSRNHCDRWVMSHYVEKAIRCSIHRTVTSDRRDQSNWAWHNSAEQQFIAVYCRHLVDVEMHDAPLGSQFWAAAYRLAMCALGQKRTSKCFRPMSALPPKADMANEKSSALFHLHHATVVLHLHTAATGGRSRG